MLIYVYKITKKDLDNTYFKVLFCLYFSIFTSQQQKAVTACKKNRLLLLLLIYHYHLTVIFSALPFLTRM